MTRTVLTIGTFDPPGLWHASLFKFCQTLGDRVVVGVNTDRFVETYKATPLFPAEFRMSVIANVGYEVIENDSPGRELIEHVRPDILAIGTDWLPGRKDYLTQIDMTPEAFEELRCALIFVPNVVGISSSEVKARSRE